MTCLFVYRLVTVLAGVHSQQ